MLAEHFLREFTTAYGRKPKEMTPRSDAGAGGIPLAGQRAGAQEPDRADRDHEPAGAGGCAAYSAAAARASPRTAPASALGSLQDVREAAEREYILKKLEETSGNVTRTAELLGLERSNLYRKMKTLGIEPK